MRVVSMLLLGLLTVAVPMVSAQSSPLPNPRFDQARISPDEWSTYREEILAAEGAEVREVKGLTVVQVAGERAMYFITLPEHPAHPAVIRRAVWQRNGRSGILGRGFFAGSREAFLAWYRVIEELNERNSRHWLAPETPEGSPPREL